jgi:hypothetical protein
MVLVIVAPMSSIDGIATRPGVSRPAIRTFAEGVIEAARRRQRRRRLLLALTLAAAIAIVATTQNPPSSARHTPKAAIAPVPGPPLVAPATVLSYNPYMGVHCAQPNAITCDQVGLAVSLKRPAISVNATIAGRPVKLDWLGEERRFTSTTPRTEFAGYLHHAGITTRLHVTPTQGPSYDPVCNCTVGPEWTSSPRERNHPEPLVRLEIRYPDHRRAVTQLHVYLSDGFA